MTNKAIIKSLRAIGVTTLAVAVTLTLSHCRSASTDLDAVGLWRGADDRLLLVTETDDVVAADDCGIARGIVNGSRVTFSGEGCGEEVAIDSATTLSLRDGVLSVRNETGTLIGKYTPEKNDLSVDAELNTDGEVSASGEAPAGWWVAVSDEDGESRNLRAGNDGKWGPLSLSLGCLTATMITDNGVPVPLMEMEYCVDEG